MAPHPRIDTTGACGLGRRGSSGGASSPSPLGRYTTREPIYPSGSVLCLNQHAPFLLVYSVFGDYLSFLFDL